MAKKFGVLLTFMVLAILLSGNIVAAMEPGSVAAAGLAPKVPHYNMDGVIYKCVTFMTLFLSSSC